MKHLLILPALFLALLIGSAACVSIPQQLQRLARQGDADAQNNLGTMYAEGRGSVTQNYKKAAAWHRLAAKQGHAAAQSNLGLAYRMGDGVVQDYKKALKWFRLSAKQDDAYAQFALGKAYVTGGGVEKDYVKGYMWFDISLANEERMIRRIRTVAWKTIDDLEKEMTPAQIKEAKSLSRAWIASRMEKAEKLSEECKEKNYKNCAPYHNSSYDPAHLR